MLHDFNTSSQATAAVDLPTLVCLLFEARSALHHDPIGAERMIGRVVTLLTPCPPRVGDVGLVAGGLAPWQIRKAKAAIVERLAGQIMIEDLARCVGLSSSHFSRAFKKSLGISPHAFIMQQRLERARALMLGTDMPLCEVALACGFADQAHLSRLFRRIVGNSPSAWRRSTVELAAA